MRAGEKPTIKIDKPKKYEDYLRESTYCPRMKSVYLDYNKKIKYEFHRDYTKALGDAIRYEY